MASCGWGDTRKGNVYCARQHIWNVCLTSHIRVSRCGNNFLITTQTWRFGRFWELSQQYGAIVLARTQGCMENHASLLGLHNRWTWRLNSHRDWRLQISKILAGNWRDVWPKRHRQYGVVLDVRYGPGLKNPISHDWRPDLTNNTVWRCIVFRHLPWMAKTDNEVRLRTGSSTWLEAECPW